MKRFDVEGSMSVKLGASWFVRSGVFTSNELNTIQNLRCALNRKYPQTKKTKNPVSWRLQVDEQLGSDNHFHGMLTISGKDFYVIGDSVAEVCKHLSART